MMAIGKRIRVYADASVYGGVFDEEFAAASQAFSMEFARVAFNSSFRWQFATN
jgi:hypothetical protein